MKQFVTKCDVACFKSLGVKIEKNGDFFVSNTGATNPILNCVYAFNRDESGIEACVKKILYKIKDLPHCWWVETSSESGQLEEILRVHHKKPFGELLGMALEVTEIQSGLPAPDLEIYRVLTDSVLSSWGRVIAEAFEFNEHDEALYASLFARTGTDGPFYHLVGTRDGNVVSTGTILCTNEGAYLYNLATKDTERAKGYGSSMTDALLKIAKQKNQKRVALVSTTAAASIHRKFGFKEVCRFHIYV